MATLCRRSHVRFKITSYARAQTLSVSPAQESDDFEAVDGVVVVVVVVVVAVVVVVVVVAVVVVLVHKV